MTTHPCRLVSLFFGFALALMLIEQVHAEKPSDRAALSGVTVGKVVWDVNIGDARKLVLYLQVIQETYDDLVRQGATPEMVFAFRGRSVKLISTDREDVPLEGHMHLDAVAELLADLNARPSVHMEACSVACRLFEVKTEDLLPKITAVGNTFVSLIGYQAKGYAVIPIY